MSAPGPSRVVDPPRAGADCSLVEAQRGGPEPPARGQPRSVEAALRAEVIAAHRAWRATALLRLGAASSDQEVVFGRGPLPFIRDISRLRDSHVFAGLDHRVLLHNVSMPTALERGDGNWEEVVYGLGGPRLGASIDELAAAFDTHILPASARPRTREGHWRYWSVAVTWAIVRKATHLLVPMTRHTLKALTWDLVSFATSRSLISSVWAAIQARHRLFGLLPPLDRRGEFAMWERSISCIMGRPLSLKLPIHKSVVAKLLRWRPAAVADNRRRLMAALATLACLRVSELCRLQVCDIWFDWHVGWGVDGYEGTCAVHVTNRKNDAERKGHHPAVGRSRDPELDIVRQLRTWMRWMRLFVHPGCQKRHRPAARCPVCPPLFPTTLNGPGGVRRATTTPCSPQRASADIRRAVVSVGCCSERFSGISARKGGISTAIEAKVEEAILYLQSGHGPEKAARRYMHLRDPARLFETYEAFGL